MVSPLTHEEARDRRRKTGQDGIALDRVVTA
jgi:hypothetical protein